MCVCALVHAAGYSACVEVRGQLTEVRFFYPSIVWVPGMKLKISGLEASAFICGAIFPALRQ